MKKLIDIPDALVPILEKHKLETGRFVSGMIQEALWRWMVHEKLIKIKPVIIKVEKKEKKKNLNSMPDKLKFCTTPACEEPINLEK